MTEPTIKTIAVDAMGGDFAPASIIGGMIQAHENLPDLRFLLFIPQKYRTLAQKVEEFSIIYYVEDIVDPEENPLKMLKTGANTTMGRAIAAVVAGDADAVFSCGSTGAYITLCWKLMKLLPNLNKIALPARIPAAHNKLNIILDVGAAHTITENELIQFAVMGNAMARALTHNKSPRIGLLNIGTEEIKGPAHIAATHKRLKEMKHLNYQGFVEPPQIFEDTVDVIVTDGYAGNIAVKTMKGTEVFFGRKLKQALTQTWLSKISSLGAMHYIMKMKKELDWRNYGGAPLLGLSHLAVKGSGNSDIVAVTAALELTNIFIENKIIEKIKRDLSQD